VLNPNFNEVVVKRKVATIDNTETAKATKGQKRQRRGGSDDEDEEKEKEEKVEYEDKKVLIPFNENGFKHIAHVWDRLVTPTQFGIKGTGKVGIVAHSFGGNHALSIMQDRRQDLFSASARSRRWSSVHAVAFIDSVHVVDDKTPPHVTRLLRTRARHWVRSRRPLDAPLNKEDKKKTKKTRDDEDEDDEDEDDEETKPEDGCERVSAGSDSHDHCPSACIDSVFAWLHQQMGP
jgi:pimeloyl-ACP methyl ester carboxylesterase